MKLAQKSLSQFSPYLTGSSSNLLSREWLSVPIFAIFGEFIFRFRYAFRYGIRMLAHSLATCS